MAYTITDACISCGSCAADCPAGAISEGEAHFEIKTCNIKKRSSSDDLFFLVNKSVSKRGISILFTENGSSSF